MKNPKIYFLVCSLMMAYISFATKKDNFTTIRGHFDYAEKATEITLHHVKDGTLEPYASSKINTEGDFGFSVPIVEPGFYYLDYGQMAPKRMYQLIRLYLEPGLDIALEINKRSYELNGKKVGHNKLVHQANEIYNKLAVFIAFNPRVSYEQFYPFLASEEMSEITKFSNSINTKDEEFNKLLKLAVQADVENTLFLFNRLPRTTHPDPSDVPSIYEELFTDGIKFSDPNILRLENGVSWMENYFFYYSFHGKYSRSNVQGLKDYLSHISDDRVKEVLVRETVKRGKLKPFEYDKIMEFSREYMVSETSKNFLLEYEKDLHSEAGQSGFNFSYEDIDGKMVSFSDFRGKYVYIDLWATWCGPCKKQIPYLKELEEEYADDNIEFLSISLDKPADKEKWKKFVKDNNLTGVQLVADKAFESAVAINYSINAIPRFLLFDTEGKIISSDAIRPSNPELKSQLDSILKK